MDNTSGNRKYMAILGISRELFWKYGFRKVTVEEICREAGTSKMTFYRFFPNKVELAKTVLNLFYEESMVKFREIINGNYSPSEKMRMMIEMKLEGANQISDEFIQDIYLGGTPEMTSFMEGRIKYFLNETLKDFERGKEEGWLRQDLNVPAFIYFSQQMTTFLNDKELKKFFKSTPDLIMELANLLVYGIIPNK